MTPGGGRCAPRSRRSAATSGTHQATLAKLELADRTLARTWLFLERGDAIAGRRRRRPGRRRRIAMRIVEAQEAERSRLAQEIHDGPAQALANAIFQVEYIERVVESDPAAMPTSSGPSATCCDATSATSAASSTSSGRRCSTSWASTGRIGEAVGPSPDADGPDDHHEPDRPGRTTSTTASGRSCCGSPRRPCRMSASTPVRRRSSSRPTRLDDDWILEIRDDGRGFDVGAVAARGRRNFGLQFMRERAELIGARFDVRSRPDGGTVVRLAIPTGDRTGAKENG